MSPTQFLLLIALIIIVTIPITFIVHQIRKWINCNNRINHCQHGVDWDDCGVCNH
jgi:hypothetical protein